MAAFKEKPSKRPVSWGLQEGVYRYERHPAYLGAMVWGIGIQARLGLDQLTS